jgi:hypothetical protein
LGLGGPVGVFWGWYGCFLGAFFVLRGFPLYCGGYYYAC